MHKAIVAIFAIALAAPQSRSSAPRAATDVTNADVEAVLKLAPAEGVMDQQIRVVDMGKYNVAVGVLHRSAKGKQAAIDHAQVTEVYHIIDGSGTFVTGGTMVDASPADPNGNTVKVLVGPSTNGASIRGGESRKVGPGDVIVIPPGVAHWFSAVEKDMNYLVVRVDADHVLPAGFVNPAIAKASR
jgi:mannose-6-phosphate isomerase-like protein (cupin superfamily)